MVSKYNWELQSKKSQEKTWLVFIVSAFTEDKVYQSLPRGFVRFIVSEPWSWTHPLASPFWASFATVEPRGILTRGTLLNMLIDFSMAAIMHCTTKRTNDMASYMFVVFFCDRTEFQMFSGILLKSEYWKIIITIVLIKVDLFKILVQVLSRVSALGKMQAFRARLVY